MNNPLRNRLALAVGLVILVTCGGAMAAAQSAHGLDAVRDSSGQEVARNYIVRGNSLSRDGRLNEAAEA